MSSLAKSLQCKDLPQLVLDRVEIRRRQRPHLAGDHVVLDCSDDARDDRGRQQTGFAPGLDRRKNGEFTVVGEYEDLASAYEELDALGAKMTATGTGNAASAMSTAAASDASLTLASKSRSATAKP